MRIISEQLCSKTSRPIRGGFFIPAQGRRMTMTDADYFTAAILESSHSNLSGAVVTYAVFNAIGTLDIYDWEYINGSLDLKLLDPKMLDPKLLDANIQAAIHASEQLDKITGGRHESGHS